ncbi:MAG: VCBS repeat-containing protein [Verrucomicrobia bacterium]|nr:VCBS repeat-containing protein [Verrucomicrobiota bacterium]
MNRKLSILARLCMIGAVLATASLAHAQTTEIKRLDDPWKKHLVAQGFQNSTAVGADFTGDGRIDVISSGGGIVRLFTAPDWKEVQLHKGPNPGWNCIHSEVMDVDADGDPDYIGAIPNHDVFWLENPGKAGSGTWNYHNIDQEIHGIHCTLKADVNLDGKLDLLVNNFAADGAAPYSLTWLEIPNNPRSAKNWIRHVFADGDAPGGNHYFGFGDVDGDGRPDISVGAKGETFENGNWFAWWKNPQDPTKAWEKRIIAADEIGATNIHPGDINGDGIADFLASRGHGKGLAWFEGPDWKRHTIDPTLDGPHCLQVIDIDKDGDLDAATCAKLDKLAVWYENNGKGQFTAHVVGKDQAAYDIRVLDMDGDNDLDFLIAGQFSANVVWYENPAEP